MFELSVQEAKPLPDFTGTDDFFVSVTLNGLIIDKAMLSVINRISERAGVHTRRVGLDRDTNKELLLKHIRQNNAVGTPFKELQQVLPGHNRNQIQVLMRELRDAGKVFCKGNTSAAKWFTRE